MAIGNALGGSSTSGATSGQGALGGNNNAAQRRRQRARARQRRQDQRGRGNSSASGGGGNADAGDSAAVGPANQFNPTTMTGSGSLTAPAGAGSTYGNGNPLDTGIGSDTFNNPDVRRETAMGLLHNAGIDTNTARPYGANAVPFIEDLISDWNTTYEGLQATRDPNLTWENFMYGLPGADALAANAPAPGVVPGTQNWRNQTWNPAMNAAIRRALARRTPTQRQQDTTRWTGGNTTVAFG